MSDSPNISMMGPSMMATNGNESETYQRKRSIDKTIDKNDLPLDMEVTLVFASEAMHSTTHDYGMMVSKE